MTRRWTSLPPPCPPQSRRQADHSAASPPAGPNAGACPAGASAAPNTGTKAASGVTALNFTLCSFNPQTLAVCEFTLGQAGQFALDNLVVSSVPEPASALLWLAGMAAVAQTARRRVAKIA